MPAEQTGKRDRARTSRAVLDAATVLLRTRGTGFSVAECAAAAGVSKSGLLHHYASREALLLATAADGLARLQAEVVEHVDLAENRPGKLLRAYVRVLCGGGEAAQDLFGPSPAGHGLQAVPGIDMLLQEDAEFWRAALTADGMPLDRVLVVRLAAEGFAASVGLPAYLDPGERELARAALLALSEP